MADRLLSVAMANRQLRERWLPANVYFDAVARAEYPDESGSADEKLMDKFNLKNFIRSINRRHKLTMFNFDGGHNGLLMHNTKSGNVKGTQKHYYYYIVEPGTKVSKPKQGSTFQSSQVSHIPQKRKAPMSTTINRQGELKEHSGDEDWALQSISSCNTSETEHSQKRSQKKKKFEMF